MGTHQAQKSTKVGKEPSLVERIAARLIVATMPRLKVRLQIGGHRSTLAQTHLPPRLMRIP